MHPYLEDIMLENKLLFWAKNLLQNFENISKNKSADK